MQLLSDLLFYQFLRLKKVSLKRNCFKYNKKSSFYAPPQKVAGYYVIPSELLSVCPSVRPSAVDHSCPLYNFDTIQDNFTKLGTNVKHDQTTCRD